MYGHFNSCSSLPLALHWEIILLGTSQVQILNNFYKTHQNLEWKWVLYSTVIYYMQRKKGKAQTLKDIKTADQNNRK